MKKIILISALLNFGLFANVFGQSNYQVSQGNKGANLAPGAPSGSYALNGFESVNPFSGKLNFSMPLLKVGGRGSAGYAINLNIQKNWSVLYNIYDPNTYHPNAELYEIRHSYTPTDATGYAEGTEFVGFLPGWMKGTRAGTNRNARMCGYQPCYDETLTRLAFIQGDGSEIEFRDVLHGGKAVLHTSTALQVSRGTHWVSSDGTNATFISDVAIYDYRLKDDGTTQPFYPSGTLYLSNGTKYAIQSGSVTQIVDVNGNKVTPGLDSLGREITTTYTSSSDPLCTNAKTLSFKGTGAATRNIKVCYASLGNRLSPGYSLDSPWGLFPTVPVPEGTTPYTHDPSVVASAELPDGRKYEFRYNSYGEITEIILPTGGKIEYVWQSNSGVYGQAEGTVLPGPSGPPDDSGSGFKIYRRVEKRRVYEGNVLQNETVYEAPESLQGSTICVRVKTYINQTNNLVLTSSSKHYYDGNPYPSGAGSPGPPMPYQQHPTNDPPFLYGKELETEIYDASNVLLRKTKNTWQPGAPLAANPSGEINPRLAEVEETLADANLVTKKTFSHDSFNNQTDAYEYDYGTGAPGTTLLRRTHTDFITDANYTSHTGSHLRGLPSQTWVSADVNGTTKASLTQFEYDNYNTDAGHDALVSRSNVVGHDTTNYVTSNIRRGNVTAVTSYADAQAQTGAITAYSQYDILGNVVKAIDAKGYAATISYDDNFGAPDGEARTNTAPSQLNGLNTFAFATSSTNALGWITGYSQVDYFTGASVNTEDINGVISKTIYNDPLDRPTQSVSAVGTVHERQSNIIYDDTNRRIETKSDLFALNDNLIKSESLYDGLGRTVEGRSYKDGGYVSVRTEYDALGRVKRVTNPYRPHLSEQQLWTDSFYDALSRVIKVRTPDAAEVNTSYVGNTTTVTDQAVKQRRSITNALGQLIRVDEPDANGNLGSVSAPNQPTHYAYDTLNNLTTVNQGVQTRTFSYNSLSRLLSANNPESGTISYGYDPNGNLTGKVDARNISTSYVYDGLNRVTLRDYSDTTPDVTYSYDDSQIPFSKSRLTKVSNSVSESKYNSFDILGRVLSSQQITDGQTYPSAYTYNLSGALIEQTYPSGRVVKNLLDNDSDLSIVQSKKNQNFGYFTYANSFTYSAAGAVTSMQLGNGRWESTQFNSRLQPTQIALGTVQNGTDKLKLDYNYGTTANNGNVQSQSITVPTVGTNQGFTASQTYTYDNLNRLKDAKEMIGTTETWKQTFLYDRYGNRNFDTTNNNTTTLLPGCPVNVCNPAVNQTNNRLIGYGFDNSGNTTTDAENRTFTYDAENKQVQVNDSNGLVGQYFYDGDGRRVKKIIPNSETNIFVYDAAGKLVAEYANQISQTPMVSYLTNDHLGSPRINTDENGSVMARHDYHPFGEEIIGIGGRTTGLGYASDEVRKKFTSYEKDAETDLDFAQARYFNSGFGRFSSPDPLFFQFSMAIDPQRFNLYQYARNNPLKWTDPTGERLYLRGNTAWLQSNILYGMAGGQEAFNEYFEINNGEVVLRAGVDVSTVNSGVQLLLDLVNSSDNNLFFAGTSGGDAAALFEGSVDKKGNTTQIGTNRAKEFTGDNRNRRGGSLLGTKGRPSQNQPVALANGDPVFFVLAMNTEGVQTQVGVSLGEPVSTTVGEGLVLAIASGDEQLAGLNQVVKPVSMAIHESAENLEFANQRNAGRVMDYRSAHNPSLEREAVIRRELKITGGFAGGLIQPRVPKK